MEVSSVLLDDITLSADHASAAVASTLYEFAKPEWVSVHHERAGRPLGPLTLSRLATVVRDARGAGR